MDSGVEVHSIGDWTVVSMTGEIDLATAPQLRQEVVRITSGGISRLALDLTGVDFIDSIGLGVIVGALKRMRAHGGELVVVCDEPRVLALLRLTDLDQILTLRSSLDAVVS